MKSVKLIPSQPATAHETRAAHAAAIDPGMVLAKATGRVTALLGLTGVALARVLGVSEPTVSRVLRGDRPLEPHSKEGELAALLVRVYRSLDALVGNDDAARRAWMSSHHVALGGTPRELVQTAQGLVATLAYLDGMRAPS
jgi:transcriptional regulator with XRE-family HTH domain